MQLAIDLYCFANIADDSADDEDFPTERATKLASLLVEKSTQQFPQDMSQLDLLNYLFEKYDV